MKTWDLVIIDQQEVWTEMENKDKGSSPKLLKKIRCNTFRVQATPQSSDLILEDLI